MEIYVGAVGVACVLPDLSSLRDTWYSKEEYCFYEGGEGEVFAF